MRTPRRLPKTPRAARPKSAYRPTRYRVESFSERTFSYLSGRGEIFPTRAEAEAYAASLPAANRARVVEVPGSF